VVADASREINAFIFKGKSDQAIQQFFLDCFILEDEGIRCVAAYPATQRHIPEDLHSYFIGNPF
jgi:hypothetical protein